VRLVLQATRERRAILAPLWTPTWLDCLSATAAAMGFKAEVTFRWISPNRVWGQL